MMINAAYLSPIYAKQTVYPQTSSQATVFFNAVLKQALTPTDPSTLEKDESHRCNPDKEACDCKPPENTDSADVIPSCEQCTHKDQCQHYQQGGFDIAAMNLRTNLIRMKRPSAQTSVTVQGDFSTPSVLWMNNYHNAYAYHEGRVKKLV